MIMISTNSATCHAIYSHLYSTHNIDSNFKCKVCGYYLLLENCLFLT